MNDDERKMLQEVLEISQENQKMVKRLYKSWWWGRIGSIVYWVVIIGFAFGAYYFIQPYFNVLTSVYGGLQQQVDTVQNAGSSIQDLFQ